MSHSFVCLAGLTGAGKSLVADLFLHAGFHYLRFGQITMDELEKRSLAVNEKNERAIREEFRRLHGMGAYATLNLPKLRSLLQAGPVLGDGLYSFEEYKILKNEFPDQFIMVAVYSPPHLRYPRLENRTVRPLNPQEALSRDYSEIENLQKGGPIAIADHTLLNTQDIPYLKRQVKKLLVEIQTRK